MIQYRALLNTLIAENLVFFIPQGPHDTTDCKMKVVLASTGKLRNNKWVKLNRFELVAVNIGRSKLEGT